MNKVKLKKNPRIRGAVINTKMDRAVKAGIIDAVLQKHPLTTFLIFQEVSNPSQLEAMLPKGWEMRPRRQKRGQNGRVGTVFIAYKTSVWEFKDITNDDAGGKHSRHGRRMLAVYLRHKRSNKYVCILDCHPDPLGEGVVKASPVGRRIQRGQLMTFSKFIREQRKVFADYGVDVYFVLGGDVNQSFAQVLPKQYEKFGVKHIFGEVGLRSAAAQVKNPGQQRLLEFFVSENIDVVRRNGYVPEGFPDSILDHEIVFGEFELN